MSFCSQKKVDDLLQKAGHLERGALHYRCLWPPASCRCREPSGIALLCCQLFRYMVATGLKALLNATIPFLQRCSLVREHVRTVFTTAGNMLTLNLDRVPDEAS
jgi:hypothetical protein